MKKSNLTFSSFLVVFFCVLLCSATVLAVEVSIDSSVNNNDNSHNGSSPTSVFVSDQTGYAFYRYQNGRCVYSKTIDGGATWAASVEVDGQNDCLGIGVWYDRWTPGNNSGNYIHIVTWDSAGNPDELYYTCLDTSDDSLTTTVDASSNSSQISTFNAGTNIASITKGTDGDLYMGIQDGDDSYVIKCNSGDDCTDGSNWVEAGSNPFDFDNDFLILMPLADGDIMAIRWDISADANDIQSKTYDDGSGSWSASWTDIDTNAVANDTYDAAFGATVDKSSGDIYLAYAGDFDALGTDDDIRTAIYDGSSWSGTTDVLTNDLEGVTGVKIALDETTGDIYVVYTALTTVADTGTGNVYFKKSTDGMSSWGAESAALNTSAGDLYGARVNILSDELVYATWVDSGDLFGNAVADLVPPTVQFSLSSSNGDEGSTPVNITITLSDTSAQNVTVDYAVTGGTATGGGDDYTLASGTLTIAAEDTTGDVSMTVVDDGDGEANETVEVTLSNPVYATLGATTIHTYTINDNDDPELSVSDVSVAEDVGTATVTVTMTGTSSSAVSVDYATSNDTATAGSDYTAASGTLNWSALETGDKTFTVSITEDPVDEPSETVNLSLSNEINAVLGDGLGILTITDNDPTPALSVADVSAGEGVGSAIVTVNMTGLSSSVVEVDYATSNGTAVAGSDYTATSETLTWNPLETGGKTFSISLTNDTRDENDETVNISLSNEANADVVDGSAVLTITDNDPTPTVGFTQVISDGDEGVSPVGIGITLSAESGLNVAVNYTVTGGTAADGDDYELISGTATIVAGSTTTSISMTVVDDEIDENSETIEVTLSNPSNATLGTTIHTYTINDNDTAEVEIEETGGSTNVTEGAAGTETYTVVLLTEPTDDVTITITPDADVEADKETLTFTSDNWDQVQTVTVSAVDNDIAEGSHTGTISHTASSDDSFYDGITINSITANVTDNDSAGVSIIESSGSTVATEGDNPANYDSYTVVLTSEPTDDVTITVGVDGQVDTDESTLTFTSVDWDEAQTVTVNAVDDDVAEGGHSGTITHTASSGDANYDGIAITDVSVTVTDDDSAGISITESDGSTNVSEDGVSDTYTVVLTSEPTNSVTVTVGVDDQVDTDESTLTFTSADWDEGQIVTVSAVDDEDEEENHSSTITHTVTSDDSNYDGIAASSVTVSIADNDEADDSGDDDDDDNDDVDDGTDVSEEFDNVIANAGADRTMVEGDTITLDGNDSIGNDLSYSWEIVSGGGSLSGQDTSTSDYTIREGAGTQDVEIVLTVTDHVDRSSSDTMIVHVLGVNTLVTETMEDNIVGIADDISIVESYRDVDGRQLVSLEVNDAEIRLPVERGGYSFVVTSDNYLVIGIPITESGTGRAYFSQVPAGELSGNIDIDDKSEFIRVNGNRADDLFGKYLAAGDLDGDGVDDIVISAPGEGNGVAFVYLYDTDPVLETTIFGSPLRPLRSVLVSNYLDTSTGDLFFGPDNISLNGNLARQEPLTSGETTLSESILAWDSLMEETPTLDIVDVDVQMEKDSERAFQSAAFGDVNSDGKSDLILATTDGVTYIYFGRQDLDNTLTVADADVVITGGANDGFGRNIAVNDVTGDGISDIIVGAPENGADEQGAVYIIFGGTGWENSVSVGLSDRALFVEGESSSDGIGADFVIGDLDEDGVNEIYTTKGEYGVYKIALIDGGGEVSTGGASGGGGCGCILYSVEVGSRTNLLSSLFVFLAFLSIIFSWRFLLSKRDSCL